MIDRRKNEWVCTDEDIENIRQWDVENREGFVYSTIPQKTLMAILARTEAAEDALMAFHIIPKSNWTERIRLAVDKWRKACGL